MQTARLGFQPKFPIISYSNTSSAIPGLQQSEEWGTDPKPWYRPAASGSSTEGCSGITQLGQNRGKGKHLEPSNSVLYSQWPNKDVTQWRNEQKSHRDVRILIAECEGQLSLFSLYFPFSLFPSHFLSYNFHFLSFSLIFFLLPPPPLFLFFFPIYPPYPPLSISTFPLFFSFQKGSNQ